MKLLCALALAIFASVTLSFQVPSALTQPGAPLQGQQPPEGQKPPEGQQPPEGQKPGDKRGKKPPELKIPPLSEAQRKLLPDTRPGKIFGEWLAICGRPSVDLMAKWMQDHLRKPLLEGTDARALGRADATNCFYAGGYEINEVVDSQPDRLMVRAFGPRLEAWFRLSLVVTDEGSGPVQVMPATPPESALPKDPKQLTDAALQKDLARAAERFQAADAFSGIAMAARDGKPFATWTAGFADRTRERRFTPSTQFTLGSLGKMFTATAFAQLVDQGKASFDDTVGKFFPEYANQIVRDKVTVAMLLTHTSGMGDFLAKRTPGMMTKGVKRAAEFMPLYEQDEPAFEPGTRFRYSNAGFALVGAIVEKVSGEDYPDYLRRHVFEPAGMANSDPNNVPRPISARPTTLVIPYTKQSESGPLLGWVAAERDIGSPAGGAISTAEDLIKFGEALRGGKLVKRETFERMAQRHQKTASGGYGYGMSVADIFGRTVVGHGGGFPGVSTQLYIVLDTPYVAVVLSNQDPPAAEMLGERLRALLVKKANVDGGQ
jgi:CubicO group peptidase (beta-lactamase class C family)